MDKEVIFEEFKRDLLKMVENSNSIPEDIQKTAKKALDEIQVIYKEKKCSNSRIEEYIEGAKSELMEKLQQIGNQRKNTEFEEISRCIFSIGQNMEDSQNLQEGQNRQRLEEVDFNDKKTVDGIVLGVIENLRDIQSQQNRILYGLEYSDSRIDEINDEIDEYIYKFEQRQGEFVENIIKEDSDKLISKVLEKYDEYTKMIEREEKNKREKFIEGLESGFTLQEQKIFSEEYKKEEKIEKSKDQSKALPDNIIE